MDTKIPAVVYPEKKMVGCVLIQAAYGFNTQVPYLFDPEDWVLAPEDGGKAMRGTQEEWRKLADNWNEHHRRSRESRPVPGRVQD